ncbi:MAG: hypothetical protein HY235_06610 [Acidobacteria bacterium]|nr:hypothetical protein [Acidobacteriota bacterium]
MTIFTKPVPVATEAMASVYCYICTHTVEAQVLTHRKGAFVKQGQRCPRCNTSLDAGYVFRLNRAA